MDGDTGAPPLGSSMPAVPLAADGDPALGARGAARLRRAQIRREIELCYRQRVTQIVMARRTAAAQYAETHPPITGVAGVLPLSFPISAILISD